MSARLYTGKGEEKEEDIQKKMRGQEATL
jgi:hypothetical protein